MPELQVQKIKDSHHRVCMLLASGMRVMQVAKVTGYSQARISVLRQSPATQNLIEEYRKDHQRGIVAEAIDLQSLAMENQLKAERQIADRLDDEEEPVPLKELLAVTTRGMATPFGFTKTAINVNADADFATLLDRAIARSGKGEAKVIEGQFSLAVGHPPPQETVEVESHSESSPDEPIALPRRSGLRRF